MRFWVVFAIGLVVVMNFKQIKSEGSDETTEAPAPPAEEETTEEPAAATEEAAASEEPAAAETEAPAAETEAPADETTAEAEAEATTAEPASETKAPSKETKAPGKSKTKPPPKPQENSEEKCSPWPMHLKSVRDCCNIPHNPASISLNTCFYRCSSREIDERLQVECAASCFVNVTGILFDGRVNRDRIKNMFIGTMMTNDKWTRVIENAVDKCDINPKETLHSALARFFACINDFMAEHCMHFVQSAECEKTQDLFESCSHVKPNCDVWPVNLANPEVCCRIPPLFSQRLVEKCRYECEHKELFAQRQLKCNEACLYNDTRLRTDGRFNFDVIKELLMNSANFLPEWKKPVNDAVERCRTAIGYPHDNQNHHHNPPSLGVNYEITTLQTCLRNHLANDCVEFKDDGYCKRVKNFAKKCPDTRPRRVTHYYHQEVRVGQRG